MFVLIGIVIGGSIGFLIGIAWAAAAIELEGYKVTYNGAAKLGKGRFTIFPADKRQPQ